MTTRFHTGLPTAPTLQLQVCTDCRQVNYPPRELCGHCLADALQWQAVGDGGTVQSLTALHYSLEPDYAGQLPWTVASIALDCGPVAFAHLQPGIDAAARVTIRIAQDRAGNRMLCALSPDSGSRADGNAWLQSIKFKESTS